jgi:thiol-disulfide isomerase/thioredoxin
MTQEPTTIPAPELEGGTWLNSEPLTIASLRGRPVLIDFWDYTCINCLRSLPYLKEWYRRYSPHGLVIIGVHAPEFSFAKSEEHVRRAVQELGIEYSVVLDNDFKIWRAYANQYWPAKYLVDAKGNLRYYHHGEGAYAEGETALQTLLLEVKPDLSLPPVVEPVRDSDAPGAVCYRVTPELYLGYQRGRPGNVAGLTPDRPATYRDPGKHAEGFFYLEGPWLLAGEYLARPVGADGESRLSVRYMAKDVNLVMHPPLTGETATLRLMQDGVPLASEDAGEDVRQEKGEALVAVDRPRMYHLVSNRELDSRELTLITTSDGLALYAFTFVSCVIPA